MDPDLGPAEQLRGAARARHLGRRAKGAVRSRWDVLLVIAVGGAAGGGARYGVGLAMPHRPGEFPWATFVENVTGCLALGALMVFVVEVWSGSRYIRPLFGVGLLGGYTTASTFALETRDLLTAGHQQTAGAYLLGSLAAGMAAVWVGVLAGRSALAGLRAVAHWHRTRRRPPPAPPPATHVSDPAVGAAGGSTTKQDHPRRRR